MFASQSHLPDFSLLRNVALAILAAEMIIVTMLLLPGAPQLPAKAVLAFLGFVFVATIIMFRFPLPGMLRMAMLINMLVLLLTVAAKSDPLGLAGADAKIVKAMKAPRPETRTLSASAGGESSLDATGSSAEGARIVIQSPDGKAILLDREIGGPAARDITIHASVFAQDATSRSIRWSIERNGETLPCGKTTLFGNEKGVAEQMSQSFEKAISRSATGNKLYCY
jgi:hypothetical protein